MGFEKNTCAIHTSILREIPAPLGRSNLGRCGAGDVGVVRGGTIQGVTAVSCFVQQPTRTERNTYFNATQNIVYSHATDPIYLSSAVFLSLFIIGITRMCCA